MTFFSSYIKTHSNAEFKTIYESVITNVYYAICKEYDLYKLRVLYELYFEVDEPIDNDEFRQFCDKLVYKRIENDTENIEKHFISQPNDGLLYYAITNHLKQCIYDLCYTIGDHIDKVNFIYSLHNKIEITNDMFIRACSYGNIKIAKWVFSRLKFKRTIFATHLIEEAFNISYKYDIKKWLASLGAISPQLIHSSFIKALLSGNIEVASYMYKQIQPPLNIPNNIEHSTSHKWLARIGICYDDDMRNYCDVYNWI